MEVQGEFISSIYIGTGMKWEEKVFFPRLIQKVCAEPDDEEEEPEVTIIFIRCHYLLFL